MEEKIKDLLKEMAQAASYFGRKSTEIGLDPKEINSLVFSAGDGYINCHLEHRGVRYEACRAPRDKGEEAAEVEYRMQITEALEEVEDDLPFC